MLLKCNCTKHLWKEVAFIMKYLGSVSEFEFRGYTSELTIKTKLTFNYRKTNRSLKKRNSYNICVEVRNDRKLESSWPGTVTLSAQNKEPALC